MIFRRLRPNGERVPLQKITKILRIKQPTLLDNQQILTAFLQFPGYETLLYGSGTSALAAALSQVLSQNPKQNPEVLIPAYACPDIVSAVAYSGATPILVDILPDIPWLDPSKVVEAINTNTVAIIYIRFLGLSANDQELRKLLTPYRISLIEDLAHSFPLSTTIQSSADMIVLSFGRGKPVSMRYGGALLRKLGASNHAAEAHAAKGIIVNDSFTFRLYHWLSCVLYNAGVHPFAYWTLTQIANLKFDTIHYQALQNIAGFPANLIELIPEAIEIYKSRENWKQVHIESILRENRGPWIDIAKQCCLYATTDKCSTNPQNTILLRYPLLLDSKHQRDKLFFSLQSRGLGASRMYHVALSELPILTYHLKRYNTPSAKSFARRMLTLPLHSDVQEVDLLKINSELKTFISNEISPIHAGSKVSIDKLR